MTFQVTIQYPDGRREALRFQKDTVYLGRRRGNDIQLGFPFVSGRHCLFRSQNNRIYVQDLGSTNGTMINGQTLEPQTPQLLHPNDVIQIGTLEIRVEPIPEATIIESVPDLAEPRPAASRTVTDRAPAESAGGPSAMWQLQTGMFSYEETPPVTAAHSAPEAPVTSSTVSTASRDFERSVVGSKTPVRDAETVAVGPPVGLIFQVLGLGVMITCLVLLIVVLLL